MGKPWVYIAGPYSKPNVAVNVNVAGGWWHRLFDTGLIVPYAPHVSIVLDMLKPRIYQDWLDYDIELLQRFDALFRIDGESSGVDGEVRKMTEFGRPIFREREYDIMIDWAKKWRGDRFTS